MESDVSARDLIMAAYHLILLDQISGLPDWADNDHFDIDARLDPDNAQALDRMPKQIQDRQTELMLQAALADRFNLRARHTTKQLPVYNLVIAKSGPKLKEASSSEKSSYTVKLGPVCKIESKSIEIPTLIAALSNSVGRLIIDKTGLTGNYELTLRWDMTDRAGSSVSPLFSALPDELGLKLEPATAPVDVIVIEHIEHPSPN